MDVLTVLGVIGIVVGIIAGVVQVVDYLQKRRQEDEQRPSTESIKNVAKPAPQINQVDPTYLAHLRRLFTSLFSDSELHNLAFDLGVEYESLPGNSKDDKARELIAYMQRNSRLDDLIALGRNRRPNAPWDEVTDSTIRLVSDLAGIPHNLPRRQNFVGREAEKAAVLDALKSNDYLISVEGIGGIGKSSLAVEVTHLCLEASQSSGSSEDVPTFNGFVWTSAKDQGLTLGILIDTIARTLNYPGIAQLPLDESLVEARKLLQANPYLLVVDNFETVTDDAVRTFLHDLPAPSQSLVTTREQRLRNARIVVLKEFTKTDAFELIREEGKRLGLKALETATEDSLLPLYQATGGAPLAIKWATGQIKQRGQSLETVIAALKDAKGVVFDNIFLRSWSLLTDNARTVLITMPLFSAPADRADIEAVSDIHNSQLDVAIGQLVEMSMLNVTDDLDVIQRRYDVHPLTRSFARANLAQNQNFEVEARLRLAKYYAERSCQEMGAWGNVSGFPWFEAELPNIFLSFDWINEVEEWELVVKIFQCIYFFLGTRGYWQERVHYGQIALAAAQKSNDVKAIANVQHALGWVLLRQNKYSEADEILKQSIRFYLSIGDNYEATLVTITRAQIAISCQELEKAASIIERAEEIASSERLSELETWLLSIRGKLEFNLGHYDEAYSLFQQALKDLERVSIGTSIGSRQIDLGYVVLHQDKPDEASSYFESALQSSEKVYRQDNIAKAQLGLARVYALQGKKSEAQAFALSAREKFTRMVMQNEIEQADQLLQELTMDNQV